jgi:O-antigen/teichoic acid export membrane protein
MKSNIIANILGRFWGVISGFVFIPLYIKYLGFENYSIISFTLIISAMMAILDAGLTATLSREFARSDINKKEKISIFKTLETCYIIIAVICILIVFSSSSTIVSYLLNLTSISENKASYCIKIISFDIAFQLLFRFYMGGLLGLEKQIKANAYQVGLGVLRNGLVLFGIIFIPSLELFFYWQAGASIIFTLLIKLALEKELSGHYIFTISFKLDKKIIRKIWKFAGGMMLISLVAALNSQMDKVIISSLLSIETLGYYMLAVSISTGLTILVSPISTAILPRFTSLFSSGHIEKVSLLFSKTSIFVAILIFSFMANMIFFAEEILYTWTGDFKLAESSAVFLPFMAVAMGALSLAFIPFNVAIANGYTKINNILGIISLCLVLPGYWFATKIYGAIGASVVYCVAQVIITLVYIYIINQKFVKIKLSEIYLKQILQPLILSLIITYLFTLTPIFSHSDRWLMILSIGSSILITLMINIIILVPRKEIKYLLSK